MSTMAERSTAFVPGDDVGVPIRTAPAEMRNVLFSGGEPSGVIDFYFACTDYFAYDLAICLNAWCFAADHTFDEASGRALLAGYESVRTPSRAGADAFALCRGAALHFLLTRLVDWRDGRASVLVTPKDPLEYVRKLAFHQSISSSVDYGRMNPAT